MTPAINSLKKNKIKYQLHPYQHDASHKSYGLQAAQKMGFPVAQVFKTLVVSIDNKKLVVAVIPVASKLSMKNIAKATNAKKAAMASPQDVERSTGYVLGGVSPLGQKKRLLTIIDSSASRFERIYVSAGRRGLEIELSSKDLQTLSAGKFFTLSQ